jgi:HEAT repeat protein
MKRRRRFITLAVLGLVALIGFAMFRPGPPEPVYQGKALRDWLEHFDHNPDAPTYRAAQEAVRAMGTNALPFLIRYLRTKDLPFQPLRVRLKARMGLLRRGEETAGDWRRRAAVACGKLGTDGAPAIPALVAAMENEDAANAAGYSLSMMLPKSASVLTNILATGNSVARSAAATALGKAYLHPEVEEMARLALVRALQQDPDPRPRGAAARAFWSWNQRLDLVVPALTGALSDPHPMVRGQAASSLGTLGSPSKPAVPELLKLLKDTDAFLRKQAADALLRIDPEAAAKAGVVQERP